MEAIAAPVRDTSALEAVVATQAREPNGGLIVMPDTFSDATMILLGYRHGLRASELCGLQWSQVELATSASKST